jgi:glyoxylase-like metal-dependent hydrolase (beta-lactamase superfamily II)
MQVEHFFDGRTSTLTYLVFDEAERIGVVIDPVLDFDPAGARTWTESCETVAAFIGARGLSIPFVLETHAHADHISGMPYFKDRYGAKTVIGAGITEVQEVFRELFNLGDDFATDGHQFDVLLADDQCLDVGPFEIRALHTPGHTSACLSYLIEDALFVGDVLFQPDYGTARCDFPGGSAEVLYETIDRLYRTLPGDTRVFTCHDYQPGGRDVEFESSIREQREHNVQLNDTTRRADFVRFRRKRDGELAMPALILPSVQMNIRAGNPPEPETNGLAYLKLPLNALGKPK